MIRVLLLTSVGEASSFIKNSSLAMLLLFRNRALLGGSFSVLLGGISTSKISSCEAIEALLMWLVDSKCYLRVILRGFERFYVIWLVDALWRIWQWDGLRGTVLQLHDAAREHNSDLQAQQESHCQECLDRMRENFCVLHENLTFSLFDEVVHRFELCGMRKGGKMKINFSTRPPTWNKRWG